MFMKTYRVILEKSYAITVKADNAQKAKCLAEFYTNNIKDISACEDRKKFNFLIEKIECVINESLEAQEVQENY